MTYPQMPPLQPQMPLQGWTPEFEQQLLQQWGQPAPAAPPVGTPSFEAAQAAAAPMAAPAAAPVEDPAGGGLGDALRGALRVAVGLAFVGAIGYVTYRYASRAMGHSHSEAPATSPATAADA